MDYSDDACLTRFSLEQSNRMRCSLISHRPNIYTPGETASPLPPAPPGGFALPPPPFTAPPRPCRCSCNNWSYQGFVVNGCANPGNLDSRDWCVSTSGPGCIKEDGSLATVNWFYCSQANQCAPPTTMPPPPVVTPPPPPPQPPPPPPPPPPPNPKAPPPTPMLPPHSPDHHHSPHRQHPHSHQPHSHGVPPPAPLQSAPTASESSPTRGGAGMILVIWLAVTMLLLVVCVLWWHRRPRRQTVSSKAAATPGSQPESQPSPSTQREVPHRWWGEWFHADESPHRGMGGWWKSSSPTDGTHAHEKRQGYVEGQGMGQAHGVWHGAFGWIEGWLPTEPKRRPLPALPAPNLQRSASRISREQTKRHINEGSEDRAPRDAGPKSSRASMRHVWREPRPADGPTGSSPNTTTAAEAPSAWTVPSWLEGWLPAEPLRQQMQPTAADGAGASTGAARNGCRPVCASMEQRDAKLASRRSIGEEPAPKSVLIKSSRGTLHDVLAAQRKRERSERRRASQQPATRQLFGFWAEKTGEELPVPPVLPAPQSKRMARAGDARAGASPNWGVQRWLEGWLPQDHCKESATPQLPAPSTPALPRRKRPPPAVLAAHRNAESGATTPPPFFNWLDGLKPPKDGGQRRSAVRM